MRVGGAIDEFLTAIVPERRKRREEAEQVLALLQLAGCRAVIRAGAVRVEPAVDVPKDLAAWLVDPLNREAIEDLMDERQEAGMRDNRAA
jgi:hypothetical protein